MAHTHFDFGIYKCIKFTSSETWATEPDCKKVDVLVVAGGGGGGSNKGGGGGAGGTILTLNMDVAGNITVTIGPGGAGDVKGSNSIFSTITAEGGGDGGFDYPDGVSRNGAAGGSGGGACRDGTIGSGTSGQGSNGGLGYGTSPLFCGGGGGGKGAVGGNASIGGVGVGGAGYDYSAIFGTTVGVNGVFAGGGGGGVYYEGGNAWGGAGGGGGGGAGGRWWDSAGQIGSDGQVNTGGGAGGGAGNAAGGTGGSGVVVLRYIPVKPSGFFNWFFSEAWRKHDKLWAPEKRILLPKDLSFQF